MLDGCQSVVCSIRKLKLQTDLHLALSQQQFSSPQSLLWLSTDPPIAFDFFSAMVPVVSNFSLLDQEHSVSTDTS